MLYRVAPDQDLAGYPANFFAGYPVSGQKYTKKNFYLNFELLITRSNIQQYPQAFYNILTITQEVNLT